MGIIQKYPKFGATGGFSQVTEDTKIEESELTISQFTAVFQHSMTKECSFSKSSCYWGINYDSTYILDTISLDIADLIDQAHIDSNQLGDTVSQDILLTKYNCCRILGAHATLIVEGKGNYPETFIVGSVSTPPFDLSTAIGSLSINGIITQIAVAEEVNSMYISDYRTDETESDWTKFHIEYKLRVNSPDKISIALPLIEGEQIDMVCPFDGPSCNTYHINYTLTTKDFARITATVTKYPLKQ